MDVYDQSRISQVYGGTVSLIVLATLLVIARLIARRVSVAGFWWDDYTIIAALVFDWGLSVCYWIEIKHAGLGRHTVAAGGPTDSKALVRFFKLFLAIQVLYFSSAATIKTSLILLYYRIFHPIRWFRYLLAVTWAVVLLYFIACLLVAIFECNPVPFYWDKSIKGGSCIDQNQFYRWNGVANLLIDFVIWSLTIPVIWHLKLDIRRKILLSAIFLLGLLACIASIVRVTSFSELVLSDITYTIVSASIWTTIEQSVGIICACLPTTRPLFGKLLQEVKQHSGGSSIDRHATKPTATTNLSKGTKGEEGDESRDFPLSTFAAGIALDGKAKDAGQEARTARKPADMDAGSIGVEEMGGSGLVGTQGVTANASKVDKRLPVVEGAILRKQTMESKVEGSEWV